MPNSRVPYEMSYGARTSLDQLYHSVLQNSEWLKAAGFSCPWEFYHAGQGDRLFVSERSDSCEGRTVLATMAMPSEGSEIYIPLLLTYLPGLKTLKLQVDIHGSIKPNGSRAIARDVRQGIRKFKKITGIELVLKVA